MLPRRPLMPSCVTSALTKASWAAELPTKTDASTPLRTWLTETVMTERRALVGAEEGCLEGWPVGCLVGCLEGWPVGLLDGWPVGWLVGCLVGCLVGRREGWLVGWRVGCLVG